MNASNKMSIGNRIKALRDKAGETQTDVKNALKLSRREVVAMWENGERDLKTEHTVLLADHFGVTCDYILRGVSAENVTTSKELGLSNKAIETLKTYVQERKNGNYDDAINGLNAVFDTKAAYKFFQNIHCYMAKVIDKPLEIDGGMDADIEAGVFRFGEYTFQPDMLDKCFLLAMQEYLIQARKKEGK